MQETGNLSSDEKKKQGVLYIVSTPIGNKDDITYRALKVLRACDMVICEEGKIGGRILHQYSISKKIDLLNEQNEEEKTHDYVSMLFQGKELALISDCGTPVFADPGYDLVRAAIRNNIPIRVVPGASSIMAAVVRSGFSLEQFLYAGFLSRDKKERLNQLKNLSEEPRTVIVLETPYRLVPILDAAAQVMPKRNAYIGCNLTMDFETHHYGTFDELYRKFKDLKFKAEFVLVFEGLKFRKAKSPYNRVKPEKRMGGMRSPRKKQGFKGGKR